MTLYRAHLRDVAKAVIIAANTPCGDRVKSSRVWPRQQPTEAEALIYVFRERKQGISDGTEPQFRSFPMLAIKLRVTKANEDDAEAALDEVCEAVEDALLTSPAFTRLVEKVTAVETQIELKAEGQKIVAEATIGIEVQISERYPPVITAVLEGANHHFDLLNPFDPNGTYTPPFNYPVSPAPRSSGPDGRVEIAGQIDLPQS